MKLYLSLAVTFCIVGCASPEQHRHAEIMNAIEHDIRLPSGARPLSQFARTYKYASPTRIVAFYFIPTNKYDKWFCQGAKKYGPTNGQIVIGCPPPDGMRAGERRWLADNVSLPDVLDGGCDYIDVEYDLDSKVMTYVRCHGTA